MKSNELRIGNYVLFSGFETRIKPYDFSKQCRGLNGSEMPNIEPIPLTEEWLLKAGFKNESTYEFSKDNFHLTGDIRGFYFSPPFMNGVTIKYVHELQNIVFSLVGEELVFSTEP